MGGTASGGKRAAETNKQLYGSDFYKKIGRAGGQKSRGGSFAQDPTFASYMGRIGGKKSKRKKS